MRTIDMQTWSRWEHFKTFNAFDHPHFNMCANVDLTRFYPYIKKQHNISFTVAIVYLLTRTANSIPEFRCRIRPEGVVEHKIVHPSTTILIKEDLFAFSYFEYDEDFLVFEKGALEKIAYVKEHPTVTNVPGRDDFLYMTSIPWVSFTSFMHPIHLNPPDSIPRFAWGKYFWEAECLKMPLSVQGHHAVMDGVHMGRFYLELQEYLNEPEVMLGKG
jgi:chloramphenicol O-acetyltransferase type A